MDEVSFTGRHDAIRDDDELGTGRSSGRPSPRSRTSPRGEPSSRAPSRARYEADEPDEDDDFDDRAVPDRHPVGTAARFLVVLLVLMLGFSVGSAIAGPGEGGMTTKLAGWARDKHLGFVVDAIG